MRHTAQTSLPNTAGFAHPLRNVLVLDLEPGMSVADFGAGSGHYVWPLAEAVGLGGHLFAIDIQRDLLRRIHNESLKRGLKNVKVIWTDLERPKASKLADQSLDLVLVSNLLFQIENKALLLWEARRILKPSGRLVVIDWLDSFDGMGPHRKAVVSKDRGLQLVGSSGFSINREFPAGAHHWGIIAYPNV